AGAIGAQKLHVDQVVGSETHRRSRPEKYQLDLSRSDADRVKTQVHRRAQKPDSQGPGNHEKTRLAPRPSRARTAFTNPQRAKQHHQSKQKPTQNDKPEQISRPHGKVVENKEFHSIFFQDSIYPSDT